MVSRVALLIGVGDYDQTSFKKLHTPPNGVRALENVLSDPKVGHFDRVKTLLNPDFTTMQQEIEDLFFHACKTDLILLYLALSDRKMNQAETQGIGTSLNLR
jgi:hypothetical protein